jgi:hypothetical protein
MVMKNEGGQEGHSYSGPVWHCGVWAVILNLNVLFLSKTQYFRFRLLQLFK